LPLIAVALLAGCAKSTGDAPTAVASTPAPAPAPAAPAAAPAEVQRMLGNWLRSDGTYRLELRGAEAGGVVRAGYFNPKSINVSPFGLDAEPGGPARDRRAQRRGVSGLDLHPQLRVHPPIVW
jgi:hypothetical protein